MANILYVTNSAQPGGMEKHVLDLISGMVKFNHSVYIWCPSGPMVKVYTGAGAQVTEKAINFDIDPFYIFDLVKFLKATKINVVHAHELKAVINSLIASFLGGVKTRISHTHTPISTWKISKPKKFINICIYSILTNLLTTYEIALTESIKSIKVKEGILKRKIVTIPNGIDFNLFQLDASVKSSYREEMHKKYNIPSDAFILGNISRLTVEKGYDLLIKAFSLLVKESDKSLFLLIAGGGLLQEDCKNLIKSYGLEDKVSITGIFDETEKIKLQSTIDLLVFPSFAEGFGYVVIEAMAFGIPVLSSDLPVLQEVGGDTLHYFKTNDIDSLCASIKHILANWQDAFKLISLAKERVKNNYTLEKFWKNYNDLYLKAK